MDPSGLEVYEWSEIGKLLRHLWLMVLLVLAFAGSLLVAHILIPSMVTSYRLPRIAQRARPIFYAGAVLFFVSAIVTLLIIIGLSDVLERFWPDYWI